MGRILKALAILALLVTIAGAGAVLYGMEMLAPRIESAHVEMAGAKDALALFEQTRTALLDGTFTGRLFAGEENVSAADLDADRCTFLRYTVRLDNRGFFPAEWISLTVRPVSGADGRDVLMIGGADANVLRAGAQGDLSVTVLHEGTVEDAGRLIDVVCYVFGQRVAFAVEVR